MKIAIFGLGYFGCTAAVCITRQGHSVVGIDVSEGKVAAINAGQSPVKEPGLDELIAEASGPAGAGPGGRGAHGGRA